MVHSTKSSDRTAEPSILCSSGLRPRNRGVPEGADGTPEPGHAQEAERRGEGPKAEAAGGVFQPGSGRGGAGKG